MSKFSLNINSAVNALRSLEELSGVIELSSQKIANCISNGGKLMLCGNGGSASDSQHIAAEFTGRFVNDRRPLPAIALTTDTSAITAISNDYSYAEIFSRQINALGKAEDMLIAISTSGNSSSIINAVQAAKELGIFTVGLSGRDGGQLAHVSDVNIIVPNDITARIQECHIFILHSLCERVEQLLGFHS